MFRFDNFLFEELLVQVQISQFSVSEFSDSKLDNFEDVKSFAFGEVPVYRSTLRMRYEILVFVISRVYLIDSQRYHCTNYPTISEHSYPG